jgi:pimeloyl-ACP methyl ester carboxylesterase
MAHTRRFWCPAPRARFALAVIAMSLVGCGGDLIGVQRVGPSATTEQIGINALTAATPSAGTALLLRGNSLAEIFASDPQGALAHLRRIAVAERDRASALAVAEMSFLAARESGSRDLYFSAACYAWFALFDEELGPAFSSFDPRFRLCCDLYNRTLSEALKDEHGDIVIAPGAWRIGDALIDVSVDMRHVAFDLTRLPRFVPSSEYRVLGLENRHRISGLGTPVIAVPSRDEPPPSSTREALSRPSCAGATLLLRLDGGIDELNAGTLTSTLELRQAALGGAVKVGSTAVPLEFDITATIAYFMQATRLLDFELTMFLGSDTGDDYFTLFTPFPYQKGRVPVVFVHGTNSSLPRWSSQLNDLLADPELRGSIQPWFFVYPSSVPIPVSSERLRLALKNARDEFDPEHTDPALDAMLVIGHSQGGLLTRHLVVDDRDAKLWNSIFNRGIDELDLEPETREFARRVFFFTPSPWVKRTIYISTPHRGSYQADRWIVQAVNRLLTLPADLVGSVTDIVTLNRDAFRSDMSDASPGSLNGMRTDNPYLLALADLKAAPNVVEHCICAIDGDEEPPAGGDGVVKYESANLPGAASTFLVRDWHSCQGNPHVVNEVRRILREHVRAFRGASAGPAH